MLFMDALELDSYDTSQLTPDLLPGNVRRELLKAYAAFSSGTKPYPAVVTGLWGCGSFGGNAQIKTLLQWCAASYANVPLKVVVQEDQVDFIAAFEEFTENVTGKGWTVEDVLRVLDTLRPEDSWAREALSYIIQTSSADSSNAVLS